MCNADPERSFRLLNEYHSAQHKSSWLTREYFEMMRAADALPVNFRAYAGPSHGTPVLHTDPVVA